MWHLFNSSEFFEINEAVSRAKKDVKGGFARFLLLLRLSSSHREYSFLLKKFVDNTYKKMTSIKKKSVHATLRTISTTKKIIHSRNSQKPFFLFLNIMETHNQYNPPSGITAFEKISPKTRLAVLKKFDWHHYALSPSLQRPLKYLMSFTTVRSCFSIPSCGISILF